MNVNISSYCDVVHFYWARCRSCAQSRPRSPGWRPCCPHRHRLIVDSRDVLDAVAGRDRPVNRHEAAREVGLAGDRHHDTEEIALLSNRRLVRGVADAGDGLAQGCSCP